MVSDEISFEHLPSEIINYYILVYLDWRALLSACGVSRTWYRLLNSVTRVWHRASKSLGLQIRDDIGWRMCRALFVRLAQRWVTINETGCISTRYFLAPNVDQITAIYYYNGKLATGSRGGTINLWECATNTCLWTSERLPTYATSIKFDDVVIMASYCNGTIVSLDTSTGRSRRIYYSPCPYAVTVDYMTEADIVVSSNTFIVGWTMSTGALILAENLSDRVAEKIVIGPYPDEEANGNSTVRKMLIMCRMENHVVVWLATSTMQKCRGRIVTIRILSKDWVRCPNRCPYPREIHLADELYFDGQFLYFTKHAVGECAGIVCQMDVANKCMVSEIHFNSVIRALLGVGKKYLLIITSDRNGDQLEFLERQTCKIVTRIRIIGHLKSYLNPDWDLFCLGERSWMDGFDGANDHGEVCIVVNLPHTVHIYEWSELNGQRYFPRRFPITAKDYPQR